MAAGDTIPGDIQYVVEKSNGDKTVVAGKYSHVQLDNKNSTNDQAFYLNPGSTHQAPLGAQTAVERQAYAEAGEKIHLQHQASSSTTEAINPDADEFFVSTVETDLNRGSKTGGTLTSADNEVSAAPSASSDDMVTFFTVTVPDRTRINLSGRQDAAAVENA